MSTQTNETQTLEKQIQEELKEKVVHYILENRVAILMDKLLEDTLGHAGTYVEGTVEEVSRFVLVTENVKELVRAIDVDLYYPTVENGLYGYSPEEVKIEYVTIWEDRIRGKAYLPNDQFLADIYVLYDTTRILNKSYYNKLNEIKSIMNTVVKRLVLEREKREELRNALIECEKTKEKAEKEEEDQ